MELNEEESLPADELLVGYLELSRDLIFKKIPEEIKRESVIAAIKIGKQTAHSMAKEFGTRDPVVIAKGLGLKIVFSDENNIVCNMSLRSEYSLKPPTILIYRKSLSQLKEFVLRRGLREIFCSGDIDMVHVAHELFHFIENTRIGLVSMRFRVETLKLGPFRVRSEIRALSEIAAHSFAKTLLGLKLSPKVLDYLMMNGTKILSR